MPTVTIKLPATTAMIQQRENRFELVAYIRLDILADALNAMEHNDTDPGERRMNADQCRDALLREVLHSWTPSELVEARIPGVIEMAEEIRDRGNRLAFATLELDKFRPLEFLLKRDGTPAMEQAVEKIREQARELVGVGEMQDAMTREAFEFKAQVATLTRERDEARRDVRISKEIIQDILDRMLLLPPDPNCTCHASPPCNDCVEYAGIRETIEQATAFVTTPTPGAQP